jgi:hypothetical protein
LAGCARDQRVSTELADLLKTTSLPENMPQKIREAEWK